MKECEFHNYIVYIDTPEVKIDICQWCNKKLITRKDKMGRVDNQIYLKEHKKDFLQRGDKNFSRFYGNSAS